MELVWWRDAGWVNENSEVNICSCIFKRNLISFSILKNVDIKVFVYKFVWLYALYLKAKTSRFSVLMSFKTVCPHIISLLKVYCSEKHTITVSIIHYPLVKSQISITQILLFVVVVCVCVFWETDLTEISTASLRF